MLSSLSFLRAPSICSPRTSRRVPAAKRAQAGCYPGPDLCNPNNKARYGGPTPNWAQELLSPSRNDFSKWVWYPPARGSDTQRCRTGKGCDAQQALAKGRLRIEVCRIHERQCHQVLGRPRFTRLLHYHWLAGQHQYNGLGKFRKHADW